MDDSWGIPSSGVSTLFGLITLLENSDDIEVVRRIGVALLHTNLAVSLCLAKSYQESLSEIDDAASLAVIEGFKDKYESEIDRQVNRLGGLDSDY